jgi:hypothetical protein
VVTGPETRKAVGGSGGDQIVALGEGITEKEIGDNTADGVAAEITGIGAAVAIAKPARHRLAAAEVKRFPQHIQRGWGGRQRRWFHAKSRT